MFHVKHFPLFGLWTQDKVSRETFSPKILWEFRETFQKQRKNDRETYCKSIFCS